MNDVAKTDFITTELKKFNITDAALAKLEKAYLPLKVENPEDIDNYITCKTAHQEVKKLRVSIDKKRKELKEESLKFGRAVDTEAKRITGKIEKVEEHLLTQRKVVEDEKERLVKEKEEADKKEQARIKKEEEARLEKIRKEQEETAEKQRKAQEKIDEENRKIAAEKQKIADDKKKIEDDKRRVKEQKEWDEKVKKDKKAATEKAKQDKEAAIIKAKDEERSKIEQEKKDAEEKRIADEKKQKRQEALKPDIEKIHAFGGLLLNIEYPSLKNKEAQNIIDGCKTKIIILGQDLMRIEL